MSIKLFVQAILKFMLGVVLVVLLLFLPAGTFNYPRAWIFMALLFIPMFAAGLVMMAKNPELLKKRLNAKEKQRQQNIVVKLSGLMFIVGFVIAGLDFRFGWLELPDIVTVIASAFFIAAYVLYAEVLRENTYLSRTVEIQEGQKVIDTGLYGIVRHPMYSATILLFLSMPLILGSVFAFVVFLFYPVIIALRISNEEKVLEEGLDGYTEYKSRVKYRLIPFIW